MNRLREELGQAPKSTNNSTVKKAFEDWLADRLTGRSDNTRDAYRSAAGPVIERIGHRPLTELTSSEVRLALAGLTGRLSTPTLTIARQSLERAVRFAMNHDRVARNVVTPVEVPKGMAARKSKSLDLAGPGASLLTAALSRIGQQHSIRTNRLPSLVIVGAGRPPRSRRLRRTVIDGGGLLLHLADGTSGRAPSERLNHRARRSFRSREQPVRTI